MPAASHAAEAANLELAVSLSLAASSAAGQAGEEEAAGRVDVLARSNDELRAENGRLQQRLDRCDSKLGEVLREAR